MLKSFLVCNIAWDYKACEACIQLPRSVRSSPYGDDFFNLLSITSHAVDKVGATALPEQHVDAGERK